MVPFTTHITNVILVILYLTSEYASGFTAERHNVYTDDGYILTIFRISRSHCVGKTKATPVILMHGLLLNSDVWIDAGRDAGLAFNLSGECYDLWLGNQRGNSYGRHHRSFNPDTDPRFWQFSVDEIGMYDIPATIDFVLRHTGAAQLNYIGYSQGCGSFYIMCSERPGYCDKVKLKISLAPATRHLNSKGPGFRFVSEYYNNNLGSLTESGDNEAFKLGGNMQTVASSFCQYATSFASLFISVYSLCLDAIAYVDAPHQHSISAETVSRLFHHLPAGTSAKNMARYGQALKSHDFVKFDYGVQRNLEVYGRPTPPAYNLSAVTAPVMILYGNNDGVVDKIDVEWMASKMPNVVGLYKVHDQAWNHFDMTYSRHAPTQIFPKISLFLSRYTDNTCEHCSQDDDDSDGS